jgi:hypothetical protein
MSYKAVVLGLDPEIAVGVFKSEEAEKIHAKIVTAATEDYINIEILDLPEEHTYIQVDCVSDNVLTDGSNIDNSDYKKGRSSLIKFGLIEEPDNIVELGKEYNPETFLTQGKITFKADRDLNGFVYVDSSFETHLYTSDEIVDIIVGKC